MTTMNGALNSDWQVFLRARGARAGAESADVETFGDPAAERLAASEGAVLCDLSHLGVIGFAGSDAQVFLQGQLTCDVREASTRASRPGALCTPKGRALATFRLWQDADGYCMQLPVGQLEPIRKRLSMYVLRSKVSVSDRSGQSVRIGVAGPQAGARLAAALGAAPEALPTAGAIVQAHGMQWLSLDGGRFELVVQPDAAADLWTTLAATITPAGEPVWRWAAIHAGEATLHEATREQFVPQMIDLDLTGGIGFSKGCYTGQEIVARTQYLGRLKQRLYRAHIAGAEPLPAPGTALCSADLEGQATGIVVESAWAPAGGIDLLAVVRTESAAVHPLHLSAIDGPLLQSLVPVHPEAVSDGAR
ncbi:MAG: folate-binding protein YgfZ [Rhodocyclaceae bacterium]|nr:folate-binding protein YgfZ [Rhodocyclaceae bacterium]